MTDQIKLILDPATKRKLEAIRDHQRAAAARRAADPNSWKPSAFEGASNAADRRYDNRHGTITVRDYRVVG